MSILDEIVADVKFRLVFHEFNRIGESALADLAEALPPRKGFVDSLRRHSPAVIAEVKKASPSKGILRDPFDPVDIARSYTNANAAGISVLTNSKFFQGENSHLKSVRRSTHIPLLRKDFVVDESQITESLILGADCILLICKVLTQRRLRELHTFARQLGLDVLVEVHDQSELDQALCVEPQLIGINNRNLTTFETTIQTTLYLLPYVNPEALVVTESGISTKEDVTTLRDAGVEAFLVGESFMRARDPGEALSTLFGEIQTSHPEIESQELQVTAELLEDMQFRVSINDRDAIMVDAPSELGGHSQSASPMELMLASVSACTAMDISHILRRGRHDVRDCSVSVTGSRAPSDPRTFRHLNVHAKVYGAEITRKSLERAVSLSAEKYCAASITLQRSGATVSHSCELVPVES